MKYDIKQEWLQTRYVTDLATVEQIAAEVGCTVANIKRLLKKWRILRGKEIQKLGIIPAWNKGLTKHDDERLMTISEGCRGANNPMAGREAWNRGLTKDDDARVMAISEGRKGVVFSEETRKKMSEAKFGLTDMWANNWKDGRSFTNQYVTNLVGGTYIYEHRKIAEDRLGRKLRLGEQVHHIDKDRKNNVCENLIVIADDDHTKLHHAMRECPALNQRAWLIENGIHFEDLRYEDTERHAA